jgi:hypothetical protein
MARIDYAKYVIISGRGDQTTADTTLEMLETVRRYRALPLTSMQTNLGLTKQPVHVFKRKKV